ncbi:MAG: 3-deoxy-7-phosphoheptulonate synthase [Synechococcales cyanobacterium RM1_1_8]|nr:3-deoxy-7-phosphoheptulonate synthase [Synechococcales cyanobacterium RM1_1_8]
MRRTSDLHVVETRSLMTPASIHSEYPLTDEAAKLVGDTRDRIRNILRHEDHRLLVIVGPCSIHDVKAAHEYGHKLLALREELEQQLEIVMRVYFEKPRTTVGWKGLINDPHLDNSYDINTGLRLARELLLDLAQIGMPSATELLDPIIPQYIADLISWTAIGARTTESQTHREMASGLSMPIGFKNGTDGSLDAAANAMLSAAEPHRFLGINLRGLASIIQTTGNPDGHLVLRGGSSGPNFSRASVDEAAAVLAQKKLNSRAMVDCSHGNSRKDFRKQATALKAVAEQIAEGSNNILGVMIESHLVEGSQTVTADLTELTYGQSITDACVAFEDTAVMLRELARAVKAGGLVVS